MNKDLVRAYKTNIWSELEAFLFYLRKKDCFTSIAGKPDANPYWWGSIFDFEKGKKETKELILNKSIKKSRMKYILDAAENDWDSPTVRLVGIYLKRVLKELLD